MIELFAIFGKGGLVLWYFNESSSYFKNIINELIHTVILQERTNTSFIKDNVTIKYKLDNEFDIIVLIVYQNIIQLSYTDKLLNETHIRFRDLYKNELLNNNFLLYGSKVFNEFSNEFSKILKHVKSIDLHEKTEFIKPRTFQESEKSKKTVASMIKTSADNKIKVTKETKKKGNEKKQNNNEQIKTSVSDANSPNNSPRTKTITEEDEEVLRNRNAFFQKKLGKLKTKENISEIKENNKKKGKQARVWDLTGNQKDAAILDFSAEQEKQSNNDINENGISSQNFYEQNLKFVGTFKGDLPGLLEEDINSFNDKYEDLKNSIGSDKKSNNSFFSSIKALVGNKQLTKEDIRPALEQMKENLINKNVAAEPAEKICESVGLKLEGKVIGTFSRVKSIVTEAMRESLTQLLTPKRRVDFLRDVMEAKTKNRPYVIVFCGVNGVGKSTNLAKITFWLIENNIRVLIAAGDTFRAGAVEQLRTHTKHLNALHPESVQLYEKGYGIDSANLAAAAIEIATERKIDVVLIDTAGRMQDNEPLMRSLSKLIRMNNPDLVLFVGEALVGNEAVDQLVKFNQSLSDNSEVGTKPHLIDGIVLTKFDTIDDKVGAAVSMTYITGKPIICVGTGQTYKDLKTLNIDAVVNSLLK